MRQRRSAASAALVLLASAALVSGGLVSTDGYTCDPATCRPPACTCAANSPPGGLQPDRIPQFILLSHDNALNQLSYDLVMKIMGDKKQSSGCTVPLTWFAMRYHSACGPARSAMQRGDELAMQANRFVPTDPFTATDPAPNYNSRDPVTGQPSSEVEITMSRKWWNEACGIPLRNMVGFRAQSYVNNPPIRRALSKNGYLYDATLVERYYANNPTSPSSNETLWPYTMDGGIPQECSFLGEAVGKCAAGERYPGLWEVPLYQLQEGDTMYGFSNYGNDPSAPAVPDMFALLKQQLDKRRAGGRTPFQISTFYEWLAVKPANPPADDPRCIMCVRSPSPNALALARFIDYATSLEDVFFVTHSDLIRWMQNPVPAEEFAAWHAATCSIPGIKADLSAVNLTAAQLALGAPVLPSSTPSPAMPVPSPLPAPAPAVDPVAAPPPVPAAEPVAAPSPAPAPSAASPALAPAGAPAPDAATADASGTGMPVGNPTPSSAGAMGIPWDMLTAVLGALALLLCL